MRHQTLSKLQRLDVLIILLLFGTALQRETFAMGKWIEKTLTGDAGGEYWKNVEKARPLIKQRADALLTELGYHPAQLIAEVYQKGEGGDVVWTVVYWQDSAESYHGDLEVYLNNQGKIRRVVKFEQGRERLIYGKDERLAKGMTQEEVLKRLGEPDHKGSPPRWARQLGDDELWLYKKSVDRTVSIKVYFKEGKVASFSRFGE